MIKLDVLCSCKPPSALPANCGVSEHFVSIGGRSRTPPDAQQARRCPQRSRRTKGSESGQRQVPPTYMYIRDQFHSFILVIHTYIPSLDILGLEILSERSIHYTARAPGITTVVYIIRSGKGGASTRLFRRKVKSLSSCLLPYPEPQLSCCSSCKVLVLAI